MTATPDPRIEQLTDVLREVLATFGPMHETYGGPISYYDGSADVEVSQFERWTAVLNGEFVIDATEIELEGGDLMLQEMSVGDDIEIEKQAGPLGPGAWIITAFEADDRSRARVRKLTRDEIHARRRADAAAGIYA